jgi:hypothetical protein
VTGVKDEVTSMGSSCRHLAHTMRCTRSARHTGPLTGTLKSSLITLTPNHPCHPAPPQQTKDLALEAGADKPLANGGTPNGSPSRAKVRASHISGNLQQLGVETQ